MLNFSDFKYKSMFFSILFSAGLYFMLFTNISAECQEKDIADLSLTLRDSYNAACELSNYFKVYNDEGYCFIMSSYEIFSTFSIWGSEHRHLMGEFNYLGEKYSAVFTHSEYFNELELNFFSNPDLMLNNVNQYVNFHKNRVNNHIYPNIKLNFSMEQFMIQRTASVFLNSRRFVNVHSNNKILRSVKRTHKVSNKTINLINIAINKGIKK